MSDLTPRLDDGAARSLDPRVVSVQRIAGAITTAILGVALAVVSLILWLSGSRTLGSGVLILCSWFALVAAVGSFSVLWPPVLYRHARWRLDPNGIRIERGFLWRSAIAVPRSRIQHTDVSQGPVERGFGLATLVLHTAGTEHAAVALAGLDRETAERLRDYLIHGEGASGDGT